MNTSPAIRNSERRLTFKRCGTEFGCTLDAKSCWCADENYQMPMPAEGSDCLCPDCLRAAAANLTARRSP